MIQQQHSYIPKSNSVAAHTHNSAYVLILQPIVGKRSLESNC